MYEKVSCLLLVLWLLKTEANARCIGQENSCKKQLVNVTSVVGLAADLFSLCVQEQSQTLTGQPGDHAHWVKRVSKSDNSLHNVRPHPLVMRLLVVVALW